MSRPTGSNPPPAGFAAALIDALEEAQAAASQAKPSPQLAQAAWQKLQFDFPVRHAARDRRRAAYCCAAAAVAAAAVRR